jgi:hypothetical protein
MHDTYDSTQPKLAQIAKVLGCPVSVFLDRTDSFPAQIQVLELLRLWEAVFEEDSRQNILAYIRRIVAEQDRTKSAHVSHAE